MNLIDTDGDGHKDVISVSISKNPYTYGYDLEIILKGREQPINIGYATPDEGILPEVKKVITQGIARNAKCVDLRDRFKAQTEYFGFYGCTILKK